MRQPMSPCLNKISSVTGTYASDKNSTICKIESVELPLYTGRTVARKMKKIVLDIQSSIHAHNMERMLMQKLDDYQIIISESPDSTAEWCRMHRPDVLLMEVKAYAPWMFNQRMAISEKVKNSTPDCRVIFIRGRRKRRAFERKSALREARGAYRRVSVRLVAGKLFRLGYRQRVNKAENPLSRCSRRKTVVYKTKN